MSALLDALIVERRSQKLGYKAYLERIVELTKRIRSQNDPDRKYPKLVNTPGETGII